MKKLLWVCLLGCYSSLLTAQDITGTWNGALDIQGNQLRLVLHLSETEEGYSATLDSPDQGAFGIPVDSTAFANNQLVFKINRLNVAYEGAFAENRFSGTFTQMGMVLPLTLSREEVTKVVRNRPQEPEAPFPYHSEDVTFENADAGVTLAGTLTLPKAAGTFPVVILISGSGPQDRNEEIMGHKPFMVLADHLTRKGIAVLRYDDRGTAQSTGDFKAATSEDLATDVVSAITYLKTRKEIDPGKIGLVGHSEGGLIAPMVAATNKDVNHIVLLAGPGLKGDKLLMLQGELLEKAAGQSAKARAATGKMRAEIFDRVHQAKDSESLKIEVKNYMEELLNTHPEIVPAGIAPERFISAQTEQISSPWMRYFITYDPAPALEKVSCPVLALNGEKDLQVPAKENLEAIAAALAKGGNTQGTTVAFPHMNHLFQECETGAPSEYGAIEQTFAQEALEVLTDWILTQVK